MHDGLDSHDDDCVRCGGLTALARPTGAVATTSCGSLVTTATPKYEWELVDDIGRSTPLPPSATQQPKRSTALLGGVLLKSAMNKILGIKPGLHKRDLHRIYQWTI